MLRFQKILKFFMPIFCNFESSATMDPALERRFHMRDKFERMKREIADDEFKTED